MDVYLLASLLTTAYALFEYGLVWNFAAKEDGKVRANDLDKLCRTAIPAVFTTFALIMLIIGASAGKSFSVAAGRHPGSRLAQTHPSHYFLSQRRKTLQILSTREQSVVSTVYKCKAPSACYASI